MKIFLALIGTPLLALTNLSIAYALATPSCRNQTLLWLHGVCAASFVLCLIATAIAWIMWFQQGGPSGVDKDQGGTTYRFLCGLSSMTGTLFTLVVLGQWIAIWILSPCTQ
jgi:hypothetical protein